MIFTNWCVFNHKKVIWTFIYYVYEIYKSMATHPSGWGCLAFNLSVMGRAKNKLHKATKVDKPNRDNQILT